MYSQEQEPEGEVCPHCGHVNSLEIGLQIFCRQCNGILNPKEDIYEDEFEIHPDDDVLLDRRYVMFDPIKAFRILRDLNRLDECT